MTAQELIKASLRLIGVESPGEVTDAATLQDSLSALNTMLKGWSVKRLLVHANSLENFSTVIGTGSYTIGTGGDFNTARPKRIPQAFLRISNQDYPLTEICTREEYLRISDKTTQGQPTNYYYDHQSSLGAVKLYPVPDAIYALYLDMWKDLSSLAALTTTVIFPSEYEEALIYNLAMRLAPSFGKPVPPEVANTAMQSLRDIQNFNGEIPCMRVDPTLSRGQGNYRIESDDYL